MSLKLFFFCVVGACMRCYTCTQSWLYLSITILAQDSISNELEHKQLQTVVCTICHESMAFAICVLTFSVQDECHDETFRHFNCHECMASAYQSRLSINKVVDRIFISIALQHLNSILRAYFLSQIMVCRFLILAFELWI